MFRKRTSFQNFSLIIGPLMTNMSECPATISAIETNFMPDIQSRFKSSLCAGPINFFQLDINENATSICESTPFGMSPFHL